MYLARSIEWQGGAPKWSRDPATSRCMPNLWAAATDPKPTPSTRRQAAMGAVQSRCMPTNSTIRAHGLPADIRYAYTVRRGYGVDGKHDGVLLHRLLASYTHLRATTGCDWSAKFVQHVRLPHYRYQGSHPMFTLTSRCRTNRAAAEQAESKPMLRVAAKHDADDGELVYGMGFDENAKTTWC